MTLKSCFIRLEFNPMNFLSPDPVLQNPTNTQNYNRYSYCLNNPLKYVDPSGYNYSYYIDGLPVSARMARRYMTTCWDDIDLNFHSTRGGSNDLSIALKNKINTFNVIEQSKTRDIFYINTHFVFNSDMGTLFLNNDFFKNGISDLWTSTGVNENGETDRNLYVGEIENTFVLGSLYIGIISTINTQYFTEFNNRVTEIYYIMKELNERPYNDPPLLTFSFNRGILQIETSFYDKDWGAFTPGPFIVYSKNCSKVPYYSTHEPGHVLQYLMLGPGRYYSRVAIPSLITSSFDFHNKMPWEKSANTLWFWTTGESDISNPIYFDPNKK